MSPSAQGGARDPSQFGARLPRSQTNIKKVWSPAPEVIWGGVHKSRGLEEDCHGKEALGIYRGRCSRGRCIRGGEEEGGREEKKEKKEAGLKI